MSILIQLTRIRMPQRRATIRPLRSLTILRHSQRRFLLPIQRTPCSGTNNLRVISRRTNAQRSTNRKVLRVIRVMTRSVHPLITMVLTRPHRTLIKTYTTIRTIIHIMRTKSIVIRRLISNLLQVPKRRRSKQVPMSRRITRIRGRITSQLTINNHNKSLHRRRIVFRVQFTQPALRSTSVRVGSSGRQFHNTQPHASVIPYRQSSTTGRPPRQYVPTYGCGHHI